MCAGFVVRAAFPFDIAKGLHETPLRERFATMTPSTSNATSIPSEDWTPECPPEQHPMWEEQVNLEQNMMRAGANKFRDRVIEAEQRGQLTRLSPYRSLLHDWVPEVAKAIRTWVSDVENSKGGPKPIAYPYIKTLDYTAASLIALREIINSLTRVTPGITAMAMAIGRTVEHEMRIRHWEKADPGLYQHYKREMDDHGSTATHRRRVNINRFNVLLNDEDSKLHWEPWTHEVIFRVGIALIDCVIRQTRWFEIIADPTVPMRKGQLAKPRLVVVAKQGMLEWIAKSMDHAELMSPDYKPTVMPPKRWNGTRDGGYWTPYVKSPRLVRFKASQESQKERAADEYEAFDMPEVYNALSVLQETPYRINERVLDVATTAWAKDLAIAGLPELGERQLPPRTPRMIAHTEAVRRARGISMVPPDADEQTQEEVKQWKRKAAPVYAFNARRLAHARRTSSTILIAEEYRKYDRIYFPHMLDFRGRMYPVPNFLQPQGDDLARGLLTYADGVRITTDNGGVKWLAIHLASTWGNDKVSYEDRVQWVMEREFQWRLIAADPLLHREWADADKPWQALAAVFEWVEYLTFGEGYKSHLPVMVDGTCNGIQHLSAMTRDEVAGSYVNLTPADKPQDIYKFVAKRLQERLERIHKGGGTEGSKADYWLALCEWDLPRSLTKRQVMVLPYGGTKDSFFTYTRAWLDENDPVPEEREDEYTQERTKLVSFLVTHLWDAVNDTVSGGMIVMKWLQDCAKSVAVDNQPIYWVTPAGFVVRHFYGLERRVMCELKLDGERHQLARLERTAKLSVKEQLQGISPNFIHSLDAAALQICLRKCSDEGLAYVSSVHDAYGTHAANMDALSEMLREAFVEVHSQDVLGNFREACRSVLVASFVSSHGMDPLDASEKAETILPPPLETGSLRLEDVLRSDYFFA